MTVPKLALSVRQPWAWAIIFAGKDIENRSWQAVNHGLRQRGRIAVHAAKGMTRDEYESAADFINDRLSYWQNSPLRCPAPNELIRGAVNGSVEVIDVVNESKSPWFFGPRGLVLRDPHVWTPIPSVGTLGYFNWSRTEGAMAPPAKWMLPKAETTGAAVLDPAARVIEPDLFTSPPSLPNGDQLTRATPIET